MNERIRIALYSHDTMGLGRRNLLVARAQASPAHGDLHLGQVLVSPEGVGFVDVDRGGAWPAAGGIARFQAHLECDVLTGELDAPRAGEIADDFLEGYRRQGPQPASRLLRVLTAPALGRLLPELFRQCRADALDLTARMLHRAQAIAGAAESTVVAL
jgi:hypothetical protein